MDAADLNRDFGKMESQLETLNHEMRELKNDVRTIRDDFAQVRGGWRVLIGLSAVIGGAVSWLAQHFLGRH